MKSENVTFLQDLLPEQADVKEDLGDLVEQEMQSTVETIDKAAARIQVSLVYYLYYFIV